jgi:hypothetical protein
MLGESAIVNPETVMDWKSEEVPKITDVYWPKDMFNVDETGLLYNLQPSKTLTMCAIGSPDRGKMEKSRPLLTNVLHTQEIPLTYLLTPWSTVLPEKLTSELCS